MLTTVYFALVVAAILTMFVALRTVVRLRKIAHGGHVGRAVTILAAFVVLFLVSYLGAPLMPHVPLELSLLFVGLILLFGAIFVVLVLRLVEELVRKVLTDLEL